MPSVNMEIGVCGENGRSFEDFGHPHKAGIREAGGNIRIFADDFQNSLHVFREYKTHNDSPSSQQFGNRRGAPSAQQMKRFR